MKLSSRVPKIVVVGSSSIDLVLNTEKYPQQNETVLANNSESFFGGKGANQAVAASRLGASTYFVGCVGVDPHGQQIRRNLKDEGVNVGFVIETESASTGTAYVTASEGQNTIVVVPAANYKLRPEHVQLAERFIASAEIVLLQLEIPMKVVEHTIQLAKAAKKKIALYAAPARALTQEIIDSVDFIIVKRNEIPLVFSNENKDEIIEKFPNKVLVRDDTNSTTFFDGEEMKYFRNDPDQSIHKMGMGDAFTAGFAVAISHGNSVEESVKFGNEVSMHVTKERGSQKGLPYLADFNLV